MNYGLHVAGEIREEVFDRMCRSDEIEDQLTALIEWKQKAMVQLEHFRLACRLYNLCDAREVNELLRH